MATIDTTTTKLEKDNQMKTKTITLYEFEELPANVQEKVLDNERYINVDDSQWSEFEIEDWETKLEEMGFNSPTISFSGFCSQGDGASFTCKSVDVAKFAKSQKASKRFAWLLDGLKKEIIEVNASVDRIDHHYSHENTVRADVEVLPYADGLEKLCKTGNELEELLTQVVRNLSKQIYRELEQSYYALKSDDAVKETILANEYTFTINGKMENT